ncbi:MAG: prepilin-type N-terminal cleavage/methylation domain-containing protein, partial [Bacteroidales bacterium]|nr:prepilin-type N-terminal cleavage/methylation domain-containing protein [Bacteroidales bacterium]
MRQLLKDKKGTTLVELLVALAILGIVLVWVATFMITGSKLFSSTGSQSNVQNEVQMVENRTADLLKETQLGVSLAVIQNNVTTFVTNDAGYTNADEKCVFMFNWNSNQNAVEARMIRWNKEDKKVYLSPSYVVENATVENELGNTVSANILQAMSDISVTWEPLAERITEFSVDMTGYAQKNSIHIYAKAEQQGKSYDGEVNTVIRNNIILNASSINELYERAG